MLKKIHELSSYMNTYGHKVTWIEKYGNLSKQEKD